MAKTKTVVLLTITENKNQLANDHDEAYVAVKISDCSQVFCHAVFNQSINQIYY